MKYMIKKMKYEINENKRYFYLSLLISLLTMIPQFIVSPSLSQSRHLIFLFIVLFMLFFIPKFSKLLFSIFIIYLNLTNIIIGHIYIHWGYAKASILPRINVAVISPKYETIEYLQTYIDYKDVLLMIYSFLVLVILYKFLVYFKHSFKILKYLGRIMTIFIISIVLVLFNHHSKEPFTIPKEYIEASNYSQLYLSRENYLNKLKKIFINNKNLIYDKVIIIQGEAVNKHHMTIYGYNKNTTPFLSSLKSKNNLYVFNAIAPTNQTRYSVPILHTNTNIHNFTKAFPHSKSIIGDFNTYGYKTYWISNQGAFGKYDTTIKSIAEEANVTYFSNRNYQIVA